MEEQHLQRELEALRSRLAELERREAEHRRVEESLRKREEQFRLLADNSTDVIWTMTLDGRFTYVSPSVRQLSGYTPEEVLEIPFHRYVVESCVEPLLAELDLQLRTPPSERLQSFRREIQQYCKDGTVKDIEINAGWLLDELGNPVGIQGGTRDITDRKKAEESLRILADLIDIAPLSVTVHDHQGRFLYANEKTFEIHGYTREEFFALNLNELDVPESARMIEERIRKVVRNGEARFEVEHVRKDGSSLPLEVFVKATRWGGREVLLSIASDITERKEAEEKLRQSEEQFRFLAENMSDNVFTMDLNLRTTYVSPSIEKLVGFTPEERLRQEITEQLTPASLDIALAKVAEELEREQTGEADPNRSVKVEVEYLRKDGSTVWVENIVSAIRDEHGVAIGALGVSRDISERKRAEAALKESEERFRALSENAPDIIYTMDLAGAITYANPSWTRILGHEPAEILGRYFTEFAREEDKGTYRKLFKTIRDEGKAVADHTGLLLARDGSERLFNMTSSFNRDSEGRMIGVVGTMKDVTEHREMERKLNHAQKMEAVGTLAGGIAHDFNNLLMGIQGYVSLTLLDLEPSSPHHERLKRIEEQVRSGTDLTRQLLGFAHGGRYEVKPTDIGDIIAKTSSMFERTKKELSIHRKLREDTWTVEVDRGQMEQVFVNLYVNAWQAMPGGGTLTLETGNVLLEEAQVAPYSLPPGRYVRISVTDTGMGMDEKTIQRIFEPFFTTKTMGRGTGLGLAMVYGIVKGHGGMIQVDSDPGRGTTFTIFLPASVRARPAEVVKREVITRGAETILLVDDEPLVAEVTRELLLSLGYKVYTAGSGQEAIDAFRERGSGIDLVILDMIMPGLSGGETFDRLREIDPGVRVLLSSGYSLNGEAKTIMERGCNGFLQKPFHLEKLSSKVREVLD